MKVIATPNFFFNIKIDNENQKFSAQSLSTEPNLGRVSTTESLINYAKFLYVILLCFEVTFCITFAPSNLISDLLSL